LEPQRPYRWIKYHFLFLFFWLFKYFICSTGRVLLKKKTY
jgi:hypothetical protein